jgi:hypothetical protein
MLSAPMEEYVGFFPPGTPADRMVEFLQLKLAAMR